jgi:2-C-methyl-D-erythritol 4-phosphate cytidylyltransferase
VEALGYRPKLVEGSTENLKITFASDLRVAEGILRSQAT